MRRLLIPAALTGALILAVGVCWAYVVRRQVVSGPVTVLLVVGTLLCAAALAAAILLERRGDGLVVPPGAVLPWPHWAGPLALAGSADLGAGSYASPPLAVVGVLLLALAAIGYGAELLRPPPEIDRGTVVAARRLSGFAAAHGAEGAQVAREALGRGLVRLVVVGADGRWGDATLRGERRAAQAVGLSGLAPVPPDDRALSARLRTGPYDWRRMAGLQLGGRQS